VDLLFDLVITSGFVVWSSYCCWIYVIMFRFVV